MRATPLRAQHREAMADLLGRDVGVNLFLLDLLARGTAPERGPSPWLGAWDAGELRALAYAPPTRQGAPAGTSVPAGDPDACGVLGEAIAARGGTHMVVGPRAACDKLAEQLQGQRFRIRFDQRLYICTQPSTGPTLPCSPARPDELDIIAPMHLAMLQEDLGIEPARVDRRLHRDRVAEHIKSGSSRVHRGPDGRPAFIIQVGTFCPWGAQVGGTFVPISARGKGVATGCMRALCETLLKGVPRVTLHVNQANIPAVRAYERAGFERDAAYRLLAM